MLHNTDATSHNQMFVDRCVILHLLCFSATAEFVTRLAWKLEEILEVSGDRRVGARRQEDGRPLIEEVFCCGPNAFRIARFCAHMDVNAPNATDIGLKACD